MKVEISEKSLQHAKRVAEAWQILYYEDVMNEKESANIFKKIKTRYGKILNLK